MIMTQYTGQSVHLWLTIAFFPWKIRFWERHGWIAFQLEAVTHGAGEYLRMRWQDPYGLKKGKYHQASYSVPKAESFDLKITLGRENFVVGRLMASS